MAGRRPEQLAGLVVEALATSGQRGLLLTGWGGLRAGSVPGNVFVLDAAPHSWLFPRDNDRGHRPRHAVVGPL